MAVDAAERLLNLIIALTHTRVRMTRAQIRASVAGYEQADSGADQAESKRKDAAFERMFERDKDELRRMGVPLRTVIDPTHGDEIGYRIDASEAAMPAIDLTAAEAAAVAVAADYWQDAVLGPDAQRGLTKLASTAQASPQGTPLLVARGGGDADALAVIGEARARRQAIQFVYATETSGRALRTVEPWVVLVRAGAHYVTGLDRDRAAQRTFRIGRIQGSVTAVGPERAYEVPEPVPAPVRVQDAAGFTAILGVAPEAAHALRARGKVVGSDGQWDLIEVTVSDESELLREVLHLAGGARVVEPAWLAQAVIDFATAAISAARVSQEVAGG